MKLINNVLSWSLLRQELLYTDKVNKLFCVDSLKNETPETYNLDYPPTFFYQTHDNRFVIVDNLNHPSSIYSEKNLVSIDMSEIGDIIIQKQDPRYFVLYKGQMEERIYRVFDWVENKVKVEAEWPFTIVKDKALTIDESVLYCFTLNGELSWQYKPAPSDPQFVHTDPAKIIGIYKNELWIKVNDNSFIMLDADTGKPIFTNFNLSDKLGTSLSIGDVNIDEQGNRIRILAYLYYIEIDLLTHTAEIKRTYDDNWKIGIGRFYDGDARAYFVGNNTNSRKSIGKIVAGIFNTNSLEIEWHYSLPGEERNHFFVEKPQANERYFGVKDSNDTLYLFEKEKR